MIRMECACYNDDRRMIMCNRQVRYTDGPCGAMPLALPPDRKTIIMEGDLIMAMKSSNPVSASGTMEEMTRTEFDAKIARAFEQSEAGEGVSADEFFASLKREVLNSCVG